MRRRLSRLFFTSEKDTSPAVTKKTDHPAPRNSPLGSNQRTSEDWIRSMLDTYGTICSTNDSSEHGWDDLSAALEHSRRVMDEEKLKFQKLWQPSRKKLLSPETTKISPVSARAGGGLSAAMVFREGPINDMNQSPVTKESTTAHPLYTVTASPITYRHYCSLPDWPARSTRDALFIRDPKLCRLLRIHRHSANTKSRNSRRRVSEPSGHKRARSSPDINWGGARPVYAEKENVGKRHFEDDETPLPALAPLCIPHLSNDQAATSPSGFNVSPYAATDSVSPYRGSLTANFLSLKSVDEERKTNDSCEIVESPKNKLPSLMIEPPPTPAKCAGMPLRIALPSRTQEVDLERHGYKYVSFLTEGSLGRLHIVQSEDDLLWVAKLVDLALLRNPAEAAEALLEAELLRRLRHPNVVEYRSSFIEDEHLVIIMEYCVQGDLHSHIVKRKDRGEWIPEKQVFQWVHDICSGLAHMHHNNVLHCDVKSSNVFLDGNSAAKIGDLGIAKELRRGARALSPLRCPRGTPIYMSPEMCSKAALTERSDCWAVGCILYEICNQHHAFGSNLYIGKSMKDNESVNSGHSGATFLPGVTHRSDLSTACKRMLKNIKGDLRRIKLHADDSYKIDTHALKFLRPQQQLHYWSKGSFSFPQILPDRYCPLLNYMVCAMLEPRPADRPTLTEILQLIEAALEEEESVPDEGVCS